MNRDARSTGKGSAATPAERRRDRLAAKLRENLRRRKAQHRSRSVTMPPPPGDPKLR